MDRTYPQLPGTSGIALHHYNRPALSQRRSILLAFDFTSTKEKWWFFLGQSVKPILGQFGHQFVCLICISRQIVQIGSRNPNRSGKIPPNCTPNQGIYGILSYLETIWRLGVARKSGFQSCVLMHPKAKENRWVVSHCSHKKGEFMIAVSITSAVDCWSESISPETINYQCCAF